MLNFRIEESVMPQSNFEEIELTIEQAVDELIEIYDRNPPTADMTDDDIRKVKAIGQTLYDSGGMSDMHGAYTEFRMRGYSHRARNLEIRWNGIGRWQG